MNNASQRIGFEVRALSHDIGSIKEAIRALNFPLVEIGQEYYINDLRVSSGQAVREHQSFVNFDQGLYDHLRDARAWIAKSIERPAYFVFNNRTLREITDKKPKTLEEFGQISGIGDIKCMQYGEFFITCIKDYYASLEAFSLGTLETALAGIQERVGLILLRDEKDLEEFVDDQLLENFLPTYNALCGDIEPRNEIERDFMKGMESDEMAGNNRHVRVYKNYLAGLEQKDHAKMNNVSENEEGRPKNNWASDAGIKEMRKGIWRDLKERNREK